MHFSIISLLFWYNNTTGVVNKLKKLCTVFVLLLLQPTSDHKIVLLSQTAVVTLTYFMWWLGYVAHMREKRNAYRVSAGKPEGKRPFARYKHRREVI